MKENLLRSAVLDLLVVWDPIQLDTGQENLQVEYRSYVPGIVRMLQDGADTYRIESHLQRLATQSMGMVTFPSHTAEIAHDLVALLSDGGG